MSLNVVRKVVLCMTISWVGFDSFPDLRINYPTFIRHIESDGKVTDNKDLTKHDECDII